MGGYGGRGGHSGRLSDWRTGGHSGLKPGSGNKPLYRPAIFRAFRMSACLLWGTGRATAGEVSRKATTGRRGTGRALPEGTGEGPPGGGLHVFLEGEVVVGEVGVEVEFTEVYFFVIGGGVV